MKKNNSQLGFGIIAVVLIIVVLAVVGAGGWVVYNNHKKTSSPHTTTTNNYNQTSNNTTNNTTDPTANWVKVDSIGGAFSMKVPDGWALTNYPGNTINGDSITFSAGTPAVITAASNAYAGDQKKFNVGFSNDPNAQDSGPQWQSPNPYGTEATEDFSIGTLTGKRYSIEYTQTVTGVTKGDKVYQYVFSSGSKHLNVVYMQNAGDTDNLQVVEQAIKTIVMH